MTIPPFLFGKDGIALVTLASCPLKVSQQVANIRQDATLPVANESEVSNMKRRDFIRASALTTVAAPLTSSLFALESSSSKPVRVGLVGVGSWKVRGY